VSPLFENRFGAALFSIALLATMVAPVVSQSTPPPGTTITAPEWPTQIDGRAVRQLPLSEAESRFATDFPGHIVRLTDGQRIFILRWVTRPTRKLHPAADCFRGLGYDVQPDGRTTDGNGREWGCFRASRGDVTMRVTERIWDTAGNSWPDVPAWFWSAALGQTSGPWWAMTTCAGS
jgi:hypothetical protein